MNSRDFRFAVYWRLGVPSTAATPALCALKHVTQFSLVHSPFITLGGLFNEPGSMAAQEIHSGLMKLNSWCPKGSLKS